MVDSDERIEELSRRIERLERGQGFWTSTLSQALGTVLSAAAIGLGAALWRNPELLGWVTVPRLMSALVVVLASTSMGFFLYSAVQVLKLGWHTWDRRRRRFFVQFIVLEVLTWIFAIVMIVSLLLR
ncbi:MAG TPA: hypothetical protein VNZ55_03410 [Thermomicrobiales bacterium]|nr:hypothetical protein [Thermomicrobiales bacterium]